MLRQEEGSGVASGDSQNCLVSLELAPQTPFALQRFMCSKSHYRAFAQTTCMCFFKKKSGGELFVVKGLKALKHVFWQPLVAKHETVWLGAGGSYFCGELGNLWVQNAHTQAPIHPTTPQKRN